MGALGSGCWTRIGCKTKTGERLAFDIRLWRRKGLLHPGRLQFQDGAVVDVEQGRATYRKQWALTLDHEPVAIEEVIPILWRDCHLGGSRPLFSCPGCSRQCFILYSHGEVYRCRKCAKLAYSSQSRRAWQRARDRANRLLQRLHPAALLGSQLPPRPSRMHRKTYAKLIVEICRLHDGYLAGQPEQLAILLRAVIKMTGDPLAMALGAALESGDYLNFQFPDLDLDWEEGGLQFLE